MIHHYVKYSYAEKMVMFMRNACFYLVSYTIAYVLRA
jgi:hypothetical protein